MSSAPAMTRAPQRRATSGLRTTEAAGAESRSSSRHRRPGRERTAIRAPGAGAPRSPAPAVSRSRSAQLPASRLRRSVGAEQRPLALGDDPHAVLAGDAHQGVAVLAWIERCGAPPERPSTARSSCRRAGAKAVRRGRGGRGGSSRRARSRPPRAATAPADRRGFAGAASRRRAFRRERGCLVVRNEHVAESPHGLDVAGIRRVGLDQLAQPRNLDIDRPVEHVVITPAGERASASRAREAAADARRRPSPARTRRSSDGSSFRRRSTSAPRDRA